MGFLNHQQCEHASYLFFFALLGVAKKKDKKSDMTFTATVIGFMTGSLHWPFFYSYITGWHNPLHKANNRQGFGHYSPEKMKKTARFELYP